EERALGVAQARGPEADLLDHPLVAADADVVADLEGPLADEQQGAEVALQGVLGRQGAARPATPRPVRKRPSRANSPTWEIMYVATASRTTALPSRIDTGTIMSLRLRCGRSSSVFR